MRASNVSLSELAALSSVYSTTYQVVDASDFMCYIYIILFPSLMHTWKFRHVAYCAG